MNLSLKPEMQKFVDDGVHSGRYASSEEVIHAAIASLMQRQWLETCSIEELEAIYPDFRKKIAEGMADVRDGRFVDGDEFFDKLEREDIETANRKTA